MYNRPLAVDRITSPDFVMADVVDFRITPNSSANGKAWLGLFAILLLVGLVYGLRFAFLGYWMILLFVVVDLLALLFALLWLTSKNAYEERVAVNESELAIEHITRYHTQRWQFPIHWVTIKLQQGQQRHANNRIIIGSSGQWIEIASCLTNQEREKLAAAINLAVVKTKSHYIPSL